MEELTFDDITGISITKERGMWFYDEDELDATLERITDMCDLEDDDVVIKAHQQHASIHTVESATVDDTVYPLPEVSLTGVEHVHGNKDLENFSLWRVPEENIVSDENTDEIVTDGGKASEPEATTAFDNDRSAASAIRKHTESDGEVGDTEAVSKHLRLRDFAFWPATGHLFEALVEAELQTTVSLSGRTNHAHFTIDPETQLSKAQSLVKLLSWRIEELDWREGQLRMFVVRHRDFDATVERLSACGCSGTETLDWLGTEARASVGNVDEGGDAFQTQAKTVSEWARLRGVSKQAVSRNVSSAKEALDDC